MQKWSFLALAALLAGAVTACGDDTTAPAATAELRVVHASADAPSVDVLVDGTAALSNVPFTAFSEYLSVPAGTRRLQVRASGTNTIVIDAGAPLAPGRQYTVVALNEVAMIEPLVLTDDNSAPAAGSVKVRLVHASPVAGAVDIYVTGPNADLSMAAPTLAGVPFKGVSDYLEVPAGTYQIRVVPAGTKTVALDSGPVTLTAGQIRTVIAVDAPGGGAPVGAIVLPDLG